MGFLSHPQSGAGLIWQIENNGSWHYEIADQNDHYVLNVIAKRDTVTFQ